MTDTHTHLYFSDYGEEIGQVMQNCLKNGVTRFILPNVDLESVSLMKDFHSKFPENTFMAMGLHPTEVKENWKEIVDLMEKELQTGIYIAVGEIGMDLYWDQSKKDLQKEAFERQLKFAEKFRFPVIIHSRNALEETLEILEKTKPSVPVIFHSFTGKKEDVEKIRQICDPFFGINGVVTYKNAPELREALGMIGIDRIVLETDAPFLTPIPHRGKRNDSSYLIYIRDKIAETLGLPADMIEEVTDRNAEILFPKAFT